MKAKIKIRSMSVLLSLALTMTAFIANTVTASAAEETETKIVLGDVNSDGKVDIKDVTDIQKYIADYFNFTDNQQRSADTFADEKIDIADVTELQRYIAGYDNVNENISKTWHEAEYEYIEHPAETEQVWVVDEESYTYEEGIYEYHNICKGCVDKASEIVDYRLWDIEETEPEWYAAFLEAEIDPFLENMSADERSEHFYNHMINDENAGYYAATVRVGTQTITVPEQGHYETIFKEAWTEKVLVKEAGYYNNDGKRWHEAVYKTVNHPAETTVVNHPAETKEVKVVDKEAYTYEEPVYEKQGRAICKGCGADITENITAHQKKHALNGEAGGYYVTDVKVQVGTKTVTVPEEYHYETKVVKEAWTETVVVKEAWTEKVLVREAGYY